MTLKSGKNATKLYRATWIKHDLCGDIEVTRFSISDQIEDIHGKKQPVYIRVTVWENLPMAENEIVDVRLLYYYDFSINEKAKKMPDGSIVGIPIYSMSAKVEVIKPNMQRNMQPADNMQ